MRDRNVTSRIMSSIPSKNTKPERLLGSAMWRIGLRYRKHYPIQGKPDFVFLKSKIAVFCDGDFWHGNNWKIRGLNSLEEELSRYKPYWKNKILKNIERDKLVNKKLKDEGWIVMRFWESNIKKTPEKIATEVKEIVLDRTSSLN